MHSTQEPFDPDQIDVILPDLETARRRPALYLGSLETEGLHNLLGYAIGGILSHYHVLDRPLDALTVRLNDDGSATVASRGPRVGDRTLAKSAEGLRWEMEKMGCPGPVALCVVNSLSSRLDVTFRASESEWHHFIYRERLLCYDAVDVDAAREDDIALTFWPDETILRVTRFDYARICASLPSFVREFDYVTSLERQWSGADVALAVHIEVVDLRR